MAKIYSKSYEKISTFLFLISSFFSLIIHKIRAKNAKIIKYDKINNFEKYIRSLPKYSKQSFYYVSTDIINSTKLWNTDPMYMKREIAYHHRVGSILIYELNGYESKKEGDAYFAVFDNFDSAFNFATEFQNLMKGHLSLRIGISKGEAIIVDVDGKYQFIGYAASHTNTVCDAGDADDILIDGYNYFSIKKC